MDNSRTTSIGLWRYAREFAEAAQIVTASNPNSIPTPAFYLAGHSIELSLKAFLRGAGVTVSELRQRDLGHDLRALVMRTLDLGLDKEILLSQVDHAVIRILNIEYTAKRFEYIETGTKHLPEWSLLESLAFRLVYGLEAYCRRSDVVRHPTLHSS